MVIRCTARLLRLLGDPAPVAADAVPPGANDWYVNLLWVERRKCVLATHAGTRFSIFIKDVRKADVAPLGQFLTAAIAAELRSERLPADALGSLEGGGAIIAKTASRSVLGTMNDITIHIAYAVARCGGLGETSVGKVNHQLQRTLHRYGTHYATALDLILQRDLAPTSNPTWP